MMNARQWHSWCKIWWYKPPRYQSRIQRTWCAPWTTPCHHWMPLIPGLVCSRQRIALITIPLPKTQCHCCKGTCRTCNTRTMRKRIFWIDDNIPRIKSWQYICQSCTIRCDLRTKMLMLLAMKKTLSDRIVGLFGCHVPCHHRTSHSQRQWYRRICRDLFV